MCYYQSPAGLYEEWAAGVPSEYQADRTETVLFFCSANTISTTSRDLRKSIRGEWKQGWSRNDNTHCSLCIECNLASFIFSACISLFCPLLFMLSFFHPVCWPLRLFLKPLAHWLSLSPGSNCFSLFIKNNNSWDLPRLFRSAYIIITITAIVIIISKPH